MMRAMLERDWLLGVARRERDALGRAIQYTDPDAWEKPSPWRGRPIADILCHLAADEIAAAALYGDEEASELEEWRKTTDEQTTESWIEWSTARRLQQHPVRTGLEWGRAADLFIARASKTGEEDWRGTSVPWIGDDLRLGYLVQHRTVQWWIHGQDLLEGGGQDLRREHDPTFVVNDFAIRLLPYALSVEGLSFPGKIVRVELQHVGGGVWAQGLDAGVTPDVGERPDIVIEGFGPWFALLAARRITADQVLYEGTVNIGGDIEAGEAVLRSLRAFP